MKVDEMRLLDLLNEEEEHAQAMADTGYWGSAGAGCIVMAESTRRILLPLRSKAVDVPLTWAGWGGAIDRGEDPQEACVRELGEEAGYSGPISGIVHLYQFQDNDFRYDTFLIIVPDEFEPEINWETHKAEWIEFGNWPTPMHPGFEEVVNDSAAMGKVQAAVSA